MPNSTQAQNRSYEYWRLRILYSTMLGYIFFYFIRKNLSMAMPEIEKSGLDITKADLGFFLMLHGILYGVSRFANGILGDRINPRYFMAAGLMLCALANFGFGMSSTVWLMGIFWVANGWFQGMGFPPCAKSLSHWFAAEERGVKFSIWNTSHSIGAGFVFLVCWLVIEYTNNWRFCFFVPGIIAILGTFFLINRLRDTPESMGLEPVEEYYLKKHGKGPVHDDVSKAIQEVVESENTESWGDILVKHVFGNPAIWGIAFANFFVYVVRFTFLDWAPTFLQQARHLSVRESAIICFSYEITAVLGMLCGGLLMDRIFKGRGAKVCFLYMTGCTFVLLMYWYLNSSNFLVNLVFVALVGFLIYGPQCLIGVIAANVATKKAAAAANGLTGIFGYLSVTVSGYAFGKISHIFGWDLIFALLIPIPFIAMIFFMFVWNAAAPEQLAAEKAAKNEETKED